MRTKTEARGVGEGWVESDHVWTQENGKPLHPDWVSRHPEAESMIAVAPRRSCTRSPVHW
ncbi:hypothetical protein [Streptomyces lydicus]|uniref:hypothetical protein n=1 Tax=Streptomyces lydicus TaxID=47763 RepID=UPI00379CC7C3